MKYSLFLADAPRTLGKPDYPSYPQLLSVECAAGSQARQLAQALVVRSKPSPLERLR